MKAATIGIALAIGCAQSALAGPGPAPAQYDAVIAKHAAANGVPEALVRRVIVRESRYNPRARNGPYMGMMQIHPATARGMGYRGSVAGLLDADVNLTYAVRYLAGAYRVAGGNHDRAVGYYARGFYYDAKRKGMLAAIGMGRDGKLSAPKLASAAPAAPDPGSPSARTQMAFADFGAVSAQPVSTPQPRGEAQAFAAEQPRAAVPVPTARGAAADAAVAAVRAIPTPPSRDAAQPPAGEAAPVTVAARVPTAQPRDAVETTASITPRQPRRTLFGRPAAEPARPVAVAAVEPAPVAGPQIPLPSARDVASAAPRPSAPRRIVATDATPALATAGAAAAPQTPAPTPPRR